MNLSFLLDKAVCGLKNFWQYFHNEDTHFHVSADNLQELREICNLSGISMVDIINEAISLYVEAHSHAIQGRSVAYVGRKITKPSKLSLEGLQKLDIGTIS